MEMEQDKSFIYMALKDSANRQFLTHPVFFMRTRLGFLKCANGTLLPLTVRKSSASMRIQLGKTFSYCSGETTSAYAWDHCHTYGYRLPENPHPSFRICENAAGGGENTDLASGEERAGVAIEW